MKVRSRMYIVLSIGLMLSFAILTSCGRAQSLKQTGEEKGGTTGIEQAQQGATQTQGDKLEPIKIGILLPFSGVYTSLGENITKGMELYFEEVSYTAGGRSIKLIKEDDQSNPQQGMAKARQLVERDKVSMIAGIVHSGVAEAIRDYVHNQKIPLIIANAGAEGLTRNPERRSPYIFRTSFANGQYEYVMGSYAYQKLGYKKIAVIAPDYSAGHEKADAFMKYFKQAGGTIVVDIYPPLGTNDFIPYLQTLQRVDIDAVWAFFAGTDAIRFVQQYAQSDLKKRAPLIGAGDMVDEAYINEIGDAALDVVTSLHYSPLIKTTENERFVQKFKEKYSHIPNQFAYQGYVTARVIVDALNKTGGMAEDSGAMIQAIKGVEFVGPGGPFRFDQKSQNVVFTVYIRKVEKLNDGSLGNVVIDHIPDVSDNY